MVETPTEILVLLVEDDPEQRLLVQSALNGIPGAMLKAFTGAAEAQQWLQAQPENVVSADAALVDLNLEVDGAGFALIGALSRRGIPVAVVSGRAGPKERQVSIAAGAVAVFAKPITGLEIQKWVQTVATNGNRRRGALLLPRGWRMQRGGRLVRSDGETIELTPALANLLREIVLGGSRGIPKALLLQSGIATSKTALRVLIMRLRKVLEPLGITIQQEGDRYYVAEYSGAPE